MELGPIDAYLATKISALSNENKTDYTMVPMISYSSTELNKSVSKQGQVMP